MPGPAVAAVQADHLGRRPDADPLERACSPPRRPGRRPRRPPPGTPASSKGWAASDACSPRRQGADRVVEAGQGHPAAGRRARTAASRAATQGGVGHGPAPHAAVQVDRRPSAGPTSKATRPRMPTVVDGTSGAIMPVSETTTTSQARRAGLGDQQGLEVRAADLLLALDQQLEVDRQAAVSAQQAPGRFDLIEGLALVVDGAAGPALAVDDHRVERRRRPLLERDRPAARRGGRRRARSARAGPACSQSA